MVESTHSWGRYPRLKQTSEWQLWPHDELPAIADGGTVLPHGLGRSYGDSCQNGGNALIRTRRMQRFLSFNRETGVLRAESGVSLDEIISLVLPCGFFLPVTPGTRFVTLGGAVANDVHGKNHHAAGTFGHFVRGFELLRSDGSRLWCSPDSQVELFRATIGGLGLTGLITWVELQLKRVPSGMIRSDSERYDSLKEFLDLSLEAEANFEYVVSWVDCLARGKKTGRGIIMRGDHVPAKSGAPPVVAPATIPCPVEFPEMALNPLTVAAFNWLYYTKHGSKRVEKDVSLYPFFYPLDSISNWNRIYGRRGMVQWQCLVPLSDDVEDVLREILGLIARQGSASFLAVMKIMGDKPKAGNLSFSRRGVTLALDFPATPKVFAMLDAVDRVVVASRGLLYPAKDARMSAETYQALYPEWREHRKWIDPAFSSSFWRRVTAQ